MVIILVLLFLEYVCYIQYHTRIQYNQRWLMDILWFVALRDLRDLRNRLRSGRDAFDTISIDLLIMAYYGVGGFARCYYDCMWSIECFKSNDDLLRLLFLMDIIVKSGVCGGCACVHINLFSGNTNIIQKLTALLSAIKCLFCFSYLCDGID